MQSLWSPIGHTHLPWRHEERSRGAAILSPLPCTDIRYALFDTSCCRCNGITHHFEHFLVYETDGQLDRPIP